jgi:hypothetical protein
MNFRHQPTEVLSCPAPNIRTSCRVSKGLGQGLDAHVSPLTVCAAAPRREPSIRCSMQRVGSTESQMYIGGGILGTILLLLLIVYFVRRV